MSYAQAAPSSTMRPRRARAWWIGQFAVAAALVLITVAAALAEGWIYTSEDVGPSAQILVQFVFPGLAFSLVLNGLLLALRRPNHIGAAEQVLLIVEGSLLAIANLLAIIGVPLDDDATFTLFLLGSTPLWGFLSLTALTVTIVTIVGNARASRPVPAFAIDAAGQR